MSARTTTVEIGGFPRVSLLPPALIEEARQRSITRRFILAVAGVLLLAGAGVLGTTLYAAHARAQLDAAREQTAVLTAEQKRYAEAEALATLLATLDDARSYAASTEIEWTTYTSQLTATMPPGTSLTEVSVSAPAPWEAQSEPSGPLRGTAAGTLHLRVTSDTGEGLTDWVRGLEAIPGYADSSLDDRTADSHADTATDSAAADPTTEYTASITLNLGETARSPRAATATASPAPADPAPASPAAATTTESE